MAAWLALPLLLAMLPLTTSSTQLRVGGAINLFGRYGYLSISMRVVPRNDSDTTWLFREPIVDVFREVTAKNGTPRKMPLNPIFQGDFHMEFCDDLSQLLQAYFREFRFERLERPWEVFTASWSDSALARNLGINNTFISGSHCYVLVRVARYREGAALLETAALQEAVQHQVDKVIVGDIASVGDFVRSYGSHYVTSYVTGNALYQVLVYSPNMYSRIKSRLKRLAVSELSSGELALYLSPWYAQHLGLIQPASGNTTLAEWAANSLSTTLYFFQYPSLIKLHGDSKLLKQLDALLGNEALLQLELRTLAHAFKDPEKQAWFLEVVDNHLKLFEANL